jgi:hypothetical protein
MRDLPPCDLPEDRKEMVREPDFEQAERAEDQARPDA